MQLRCYVVVEQLLSLQCPGPHVLEQIEAARERRAPVLLGVSGAANPL